MIPEHRIFYGLNFDDTKEELTESIATACTNDGYKGLLVWKLIEDLSTGVIRSGDVVYICYETTMEAL